MTNRTNFATIHRSPTVDEYNALRSLAQWPAFQEPVVRKALANSLYCVCIELDSAIVGMGRIAGDNAIYLHILDVIVHPDYQRKGVGKLLMRALMGYVDMVANQNTNIGLMCSKGREEFYKGFGFITRPDEKFGSGMIKIIT
jgi:ribosomal protein S18 acetylase RimI-like enzyme